jgi:N-acyl-phosphatidylethanolamine-hydrolysing phospholipase D
MTTPAAPARADAAPARPPASPSPPPGDPFDAALLSAPHFRDGRFFNPWQRLPVRLRDVLRWYRERPWRRPEERAAPRVDNDGSSLGGYEPGVALTWIGHASFALHHQHSVLLTDPHFGPRALVPPRRVQPGVPIAAIPAAPVALVSHSHYDHLDRWSVRRLPPETRWRVPLGLGSLLRRWGARDVRELDWWDEISEGPWQLTCLPAQHWSNRLSHPRDATLWSGWLIAAAGRRFYFAGDTGWFGGLSELGRRCGALDAALLPIGAYEPRWFMRYQHMDPDDAVRALQQLGAAALVGMHWGTFVLTDEPLDEPPRALLAAATAAAVPRERILLPAVGECLRWEPTR